MRLRLVLPRSRGRAGLRSLRRASPLAASALLAVLAQLAALSLAGCGGSRANKTTGVSYAPTLPAPAPRGPAFGLTEDNAGLLWSPGASPSSASAYALQAARQRLTALHPRYVRLLVDWAALQPEADRAPSLQGPVDGCARSVGPCAPYAGLREELAAIASQQRAAAAEGRPGYEVVLDVFGTPAWAARPASGCELGATLAFSRPINAAGVAGYRALVRSLLALGASSGVALRWWSPWNEPNDPVFLSPQRPACSPSAPSLAPAVYAQLAQAMAGELSAEGGVHHLLLGELNAFATDSPHRTSVAAFVAALPASVVCLSDTWSIHAYASRTRASSGPDPVAMLAAALDARGACGARASIWITEAGAGARHPGRPRPPGAEDAHAGCLALAAQLDRWAADPRVRAVLQYSFREDPAFPVGLLSADLAHVYPAYRLWLLYARAIAQGRPVPAQAALCA
jgi:hypothetical protein